MKYIVILFACAMVSIFGATSIAALDQDDVRGAFLVTRPKEKQQNTSTPPRTSRRRPRPTTGSDNKKKSSNPATTGSTTNTTGTATSTGATTATNANTKPAAVNAPRLGIGLTLFMRDANGLAVRTDPTHVFQKGDRVRVLLETNTDGYLYILNTTNNGPAVMIYPNAELDEAGNYLQAHVPFEIPSSAAAEERLRWLAFDENAGDERLFFVFTREPLAGIPIEDELISYCGDKKGCSWRATDEIWSQIQKEMSQPLKTDKEKQYGAPQTEREQQASSRGLGLAKDDPPPSLIMMASAKTSRLVTTLDLVHK
jgi:Domain of unknown function (DUF4384)